LDKQANVIIVELKKDQAPRKVISQVLDYGVWAENLKYDKLNTIAKKNHILNYNSLMEKFMEWTGEIDPYYNSNQKLYVVAEQIDTRTEKLARYLRRKGIEIYCVELNFFEKDGNQLVHKRIVVGEEKPIIRSEDISYTEQSHLEKGDEKARNLYQILKKEVMQLGDNIRINPVKNYIGFIKNNNFLAVKFRKSFLVVHLITKEGFKDPKQISQQSQEYQYGGRLRQVSLKDEKLLPDLMQLIKQTYESN